MPLKYTICLGSLFNTDLCLISLKLRLFQEEKHAEKLIWTWSSLLFMLFQWNILWHFVYQNHEIGLYSCVAAVPGKKHSNGQRKKSKWNTDPMKELANPIRRSGNKMVLQSYAVLDQENWNFIPLVDGVTECILCGRDVTVGKTALHL